MEKKNNLKEIAEQLKRQRFFYRQLGILDPEKIPPIHLIGVGGIGAKLAFQLYQMGAKELFFYDNDIVEEQNLGTQFYKKSQITDSRKKGPYKCEALKENLERFGIGDAKIEIVCEAVDGSSKWRQKFKGIVISGVDRMEARRNIWKAIKINTKVDLYIDARMSGEHGSVYPVLPCDPDSIDFYEITLGYKDQEEPCTERGIAYNVSGIHFAIGAVIKAFICKEPVPKDTNIRSGKDILTGKYNIGIISNY